MTDAEDPIRRKKRWQAFYDEDGGIKDMFAAMRAEYVDRILKLDPGHVAPMVNLKIAQKISENVEQMIVAIISDGVVAERAKAQVDKIEAIPDYKRRWATGAA